MATKQKPQPATATPASSRTSMAATAGGASSSGSLAARAARYGFVMPVRRHASDYGRPAPPPKKGFIELTTKNVTDEKKLQLLQSEGKTSFFLMGLKTSIITSTGEVVNLKAELKRMVTVPWDPNDVDGVKYTTKGEITRRAAMPNIQALTRRFYKRLNKKKLKDYEKKIKDDAERVKKIEEAKQIEEARRKKEEEDETKGPQYKMVSTSSGMRKILIPRRSKPAAASTAVAAAAPVESKKRRTPMTQGEEVLFVPRTVSMTKEGILSKIAPELLDSHGNFNPKIRTKKDGDALIITGSEQYHHAVVKIYQNGKMQLNSKLNYADGYEFMNKIVSRMGKLLGRELKLGSVSDYNFCANFTPNEPRPLSLINLQTSLNLQSLLGDPDFTEVDEEPPDPEDGPGLRATVRGAHLMAFSNSSFNLLNCKSVNDYVEIALIVNAMMLRYYNEFRADEKAASAAAAAASSAATDAALMIPTSAAPLPLAPPPPVLAVPFEPRSWLGLDPPPPQPILMAPGIEGALALTVEQMMDIGLLNAEASEQFILDDDQTFNPPTFYDPDNPFSFAPPGPSI
jgi:hypothetical protein